MQEQYVCSNHRHQAFVRTCAKAADDSCTDEAVVTAHQGLPDVGEYANQPTHDDNGPAAEGVSGRYDNEVGVAERDGRGTKEHVDLRETLIKLSNKDWRHRCDAERCHDGDEDEDKLVGEDDCLPCWRPVLRRRLARWPVRRDRESPGCTDQRIIFIRGWSWDEHQVSSLWLISTLLEDHFGARNNIYISVTHLGEISRRVLKS